MHKVVVERPRWNPGPDKNGRCTNLPDELLPKFEGMKRPHRQRKRLTDLLGPLKRWLQANAGRPWNDVYSEACAVIKPDSIIRAHIKTHLLEFVERHTFVHEGRVCVLDTGYRGRGIVPVEQRCYGRSSFFVHPETGLLHTSPQFSKRARRAAALKPPITVHWLRKNIALQQIRGLWFECYFELVPVDVRFKAYDHVLERVVGRGDLTKHDAQYLLCTRKRQLSRYELRRFGLRNGVTHHSCGAQSSVSHPSGWLTTALCFTAGRRLWVLVDPAILVQIRSVATTVVQLFAHRAIPQSLSCPLLLLAAPALWWAEDIGLSVIGSTPICSTRRGSSSVGRAIPIRPLPIRFSTQATTITPLHL